MKEGPELLPTQYANIFSDLPNMTVQKVPALHHYRLVHESAENASVTPFPESDPVTLSGIKYVKIFEFVRGAKISGEGIIRAPCSDKYRTDICLPAGKRERYVYRSLSNDGRSLRCSCNC